MKRAYLILLTMLLPMVSWATEYYSSESGDFYTLKWSTNSDGSGGAALSSGDFNTSNNFTILATNIVTLPSSTNLTLGNITVKAGGTLADFPSSIGNVQIENLFVLGNLLLNGADINILRMTNLYFIGASSSFVNTNANILLQHSGLLYVSSSTTVGTLNGGFISSDGQLEEFMDGTDNTRNKLFLPVSASSGTYSSEIPSEMASETVSITLYKDYVLTIDNTLPSNFTLSAGTDASDETNNGSLIFGSNSSGTVTLANNNPFNDVTVNTNTTINLGSDFYMGGELTLTNGVINGGGNRFVINSGGSINSATYSTSLGSIASGGSDASHINGQMSMTFATTGNYTLLPVGDGTNLREAGVQNLAATAAHTLTVTYNNTSHGTSTLDPGLNEVEVSNVEYWDINVSGTDQTGFAENFKVVISYNSSSLIDETKSGTLHLFHYSSGDSHWDSEADGTHGDFTLQSSGGGEGFISAQTLTFSPFTFGGGSDHDLSVALSSFSASPNNNQVDISWSTATEINNSHFDIERSSDQKSWEVIERVDAKGGNSSVSIDYEFTDERPLQNAYYRLVQYDLDGTSETFGPIQVSLLSMANEFNAELHPNVFDRSQSTKLALEGLTKGSDILIQVYDHHGNLVVDQIIKQTSEENILQEFTIPGHLPAGMYHLNVSSGVKISRSKFVLH
ncbi:hypothetical protein MY04_2766 [Flammeovirga sp. MY04]|uniref:hypothetical protein n=1 Tax=Flammeovirga sp. MY04 TaxID=1191459 RepID=UPI0013052D04|nr:hypothetical protein [Flammeovirga sp. MY04]ANQ50134.2 hypothetical protein MY04_2766 [Flammeovirga sp. MY04]